MKPVQHNLKEHIMKDVDLTPQIIVPPGTVLAYDFAGKPYFAPLTPTLLTQQRELEAAAGLGVSKPLGDHASLSDFLASGGRRTLGGLMAYCTRHQVSP